MGNEEYATMHDDGHFDENLRLFCRSLRRAGVPVGPARIADALEAVRLTGVTRRDDLHAALRAVLIGDPSRYPLFERVFDLYFRRPGLLARAADAAASIGAGREPSPGLPAAPGASGDAAPRSGARDRDAAGTASAREALGNKDFAAMTADEEAWLREYLRDAVLPLPARPTRRYLPHPRGDRHDPRRTLARMPRTGGELLHFARRRRRRRPAELVLLCDVSGSMHRYTRAFLLFAHALARRHPGFKAFVFGTRLTPIGHHLAHPDADRALKRIAGEVRDFDGGTRIAHCLGQFNRRWGRRVLARGASVVLLTDGLERGAAGRLGRETALLARSCRQLLWLNPMLRYEAFEPLAGGIRAMLPHVDRFLPAHNADSIIGLGRALSEAARVRRAAAVEAA